MLKTGMIIAERYEILGKIGTGGMADVYKAKDHKLNRFVAVKVLETGIQRGYHIYPQIPQRSTGSSRSDTSEYCQCI